MSVSFYHSLRLQHSIHDARSLSYCISNQEFNQFLANKQQQQYNNNNTTAQQQQHYTSINDRQRTKEVWSRANGGIINDGLSLSAASLSCVASVTFKIIDGKKSRGGAKSGRISLFIHHSGSSALIAPSDLIHLRWKTITQRTFSTKSHVTGYHCGRTAAVELEDGSLLVISHENAKDKIGLHDGNAAVDDRHPPFLFSSGDAAGAELTIRLLSPYTHSTLYLTDLITHVDSLQLSLHSVNGNIVLHCSNTATVKDERHLSKRQRMRLLSKANQSSSSNDSTAEEQSNKKKPNKYAKVEEEASNDEEETERKRVSSVNEMKPSTTAELINEVDELESLGSDDDDSDDESSSLDFDHGMAECSSMQSSSVVTDSFSVRIVKRRQCSEATFFDEKRSFDFNECDDKMSFIPIEDPPINSMPAFNSFIDNLPPPITAIDLPPMPFFPVGSPLPFPSFSHDETPLLPTIDYDRSLPFSFPHSPSIPAMQLMRNFSLTD